MSRAFVALLPVSEAITTFNAHFFAPLLHGLQHFFCVHFTTIFEARDFPFNIFAHVLTNS
jgi:hypothetical protein